MNKKNSKSELSKLPCGRNKPQPADAKSQLKIDVWHDQLKEYLVKMDLRYTEQRWKIAKLILQTGGHLDVIGLAEQVKSKHPEIGAATVYRTIKVLCEAGLMKESLKDQAGRVIYELQDHEHHDHIVCLDCNAIFEFHSDQIEKDQKEITDSLEFTNEKHSHVIYSYCKKLRSQKHTKQVGY